MTDEQKIRTLITNWVTAVQTGDLETVTADHASDIVMFDVPPPYGGVRGLDAYRETWPGFFEWQRAGATFELESLDVTAGSDVAFAFALLRCGTLAENPDQRLRFTIGLRKLDGRWTVTHEHHSFPHDDVPEAIARIELRDVFDSWSADTAAGDLDALTEPIAEDVVSYEIDGNYTGRSAVREVCARGLAAGPEAITFTIPSFGLATGGRLAVAWSIDHVENTTSRATRVLRRTATGWQVIHQHLSYPS
jgi:ketosteroid isomerase-like protein